MNNNGMIKIGTYNCFAMYTVWVGGVEVNDHYLTLDRAKMLAFEYQIDGYDDVIIEEIKI